MKKLIKTLELFNEIIQDQLNKGVMEKVTDKAHHPVISPTKSTTKVRIVYDASTETNKVNKSLIQTFSNWCGWRYFLNVGLQVSDRDASRFLWLQDSIKPDVGNNLQIYCFCRGVSPAHFFWKPQLISIYSKVIYPAKKVQRDILW